MPSSPKHDNFLANAVKPTSKSKTSGLGYTDGFRFGFGFFVSGLLIALIVGGLAWGILLAMHMH